MQLPRGWARIATPNFWGHTPEASRSIFRISLAGQPYFFIFPVGGTRGKNTSGHSGQLSVDIRSNVWGSNLIRSFNNKHMTSWIPTIASVKNCVHDGVLRCECDICSYFNGLQKTSNDGRRCLTLLAEEKQRQHLDTLARRLHSMCACRERSEHC